MTFTIDIEEIREFDSRTTGDSDTTFLYRTEGYSKVTVEYEDGTNLILSETAGSIYAYDGYRYAVIGEAHEQEYLHSVSYYGDSRPYRYRENDTGNYYNKVVVWDLWKKEILLEVNDAVYSILEADLSLKIEYSVDQNPSPYIIQNNGSVTQNENIETTEFESPRPLFTDDEDNVDFNNLTQEQIAEIVAISTVYSPSDSANPLYSAFGGNDVVMLPNTSNIPGTGQTWAPEFWFDAGDGENKITGGDLDDAITGGLHADILKGGKGEDVLAGYGGADTLEGGDGDDELYGEDGDDTLKGDAGNDDLNGGADNDTLEGGDGDDLLFGDDGDDTLKGDAGNDDLNGGADNDTLEGGDGDDEIHGEDGDDTLKGDAGSDSLSGGADNDTLEGGEDDDVLYGNDGEDTLRGDAGDDYLEGGDDDDTLEGGNDSDTLFGEDGDDTLDGGEGDDNLSGGRDDDTLVGGIGSDYFNGIDADPGGTETGNNKIDGTDYADLNTFDGVWYSGVRLSYKVKYDPFATGSIGFGAEVSAGGNVDTIKNWNFLDFQDTSIYEENLYKKGVFAYVIWGLQGAFDDVKPFLDSIPNPGGFVGKFLGWLGWAENVTNVVAETVTADDVPTAQKLLIGRTLDQVVDPFVDKVGDEFNALIDLMPVSGAYKTTLKNEVSDAQQEVRVAVDEITTAIFDYDETDWANWMDDVIDGIDELYKDDGFIDPKQEFDDPNSPTPQLEDAPSEPVIIRQAGTDESDLITTTASVDAGDGDDWVFLTGKAKQSVDGGSGNDTLIAGLKKDIQNGGSGADTFVFVSKSDSKKGKKNYDVIEDFSGVGGEGDRIDLSEIDAMKKGTNNDAFNWKDTGKLKKAGDLRYKDKGDFFLVEADIKGNGKPDIQIRVEGPNLTQLFEEDFVL